MQKLLLLSLVPALFTGPALSQETPMDRCLAVYTQAECTRLQNTYVDEKAPVDITVDYAPPPEVSQPIRLGRTTFTHVNKFCEPEANPPEGWLRPNGFCGLTDQMAKGSLLYSGEDYNFGFKHR